MDNGISFEIVDRTPCDAVVYHGPGHQSKSKCELVGDHDEHQAFIMGEHPTWTDDMADKDGKVYLMHKEAKKKHIKNTRFSRIWKHAFMKSERKAIEKALRERRSRLSPRGQHYRDVDALLDMMEGN